jgi:membrane-associated phospholipid phosphatase
MAGIRHGTSMNSESRRLRSTGRISSDIVAIWPGALLCVYLTMGVVLLLLGRARVPGAALAVHVSVLVAIAAATWLPVVPSWLRRWAPLMSLLFLYTELPLLIRAAGHDTFFDPTVIRWESSLFGGQPALQWAASWNSAPLSELLHAGYISYYAIIFAVPVVLTVQQRRHEFSEAVFVLLLTFTVCFVAFVVFPVAGPRYLWAPSADVADGPVRRLTLWVLESRSSRGTAFPSSHVAVATTQSILAIAYFGRRGITIGVLSALLAMGAVYGGFHYAIDVIAGAVVGAIVTAIGLASVRLVGRSAVDYANATAPT